MPQHKKLIFHNSVNNYEINTEANNNREATKMEE